MHPEKGVNSEMNLSPILPSPPFSKVRTAVDYSQTEQLRP